MGKFKEFLLNEDGGNKGEFANGRKELEKGKIKALMSKEVTTLGSYIIQAATRKTGKNWSFGEDHWNGLTDYDHLDITNPGRLKGLTFTSDAETRQEFYTAILPLLRNLLTVKSIENGKAIVIFNENPYELFYSGRTKADIRIEPKFDLEKWAIEQLNKK